MEEGAKNKDKPEIRLLSKLKDRLLNLSTREQKINLRPYQGATYDLVSLLFTSYLFKEKILISCAIFSSIIWQNIANIT